MSTSTANDWKNPLPGVPDVESPFFDDIFSRKAAKPGWFEIATAMRRDGFAVMQFPGDQLDAHAAKIIDQMVDRFDWRAWRKHGWAAGGGLREQDAWTEVDAVRCIAVNDEVCELLEYLYGRRTFPFQTLTFPVGTQQHFHTDSVHFSSLPERFMCGVWVALENVDADNGPLIYYPGSHTLPIFKNEHIGHVPDGMASQIVYHDMWVELMRVTGIEPVEFHAQKGQALIWSANLFHGGKRQADAKRTRWSQVTHYLFEGCRYYTPMNSDETVGLIDLRSVPDISSGEVRAGRTAVSAQPVPTLPEGFDPAFYLKANPDVQAAGADPAEHFLRYGRFENRRWRR